MMFLWAVCEFAKPPSFSPLTLHRCSSIRSVFNCPGLTSPHNVRQCTDPSQNFNIPIQVQPQCFGTFCLISWAQTLIYHDRWPVWKASSVAGVVWLVFGGVEAALILTLKPLYDRGTDFPMIILGVIASILLAVGLLPPYIEIWKRRGRVIGINWIFLTIDWMGAFFSLMALGSFHHGPVSFQTLIPKCSYPKHFRRARRCTLHFVRLY